MLALFNIIGTTIIVILVTVIVLSLLIAYREDYNDKQFDKQSRELAEEERRRIKKSMNGYIEPAPVRVIIIKDETNG